MVRFGRVVFFTPKAAFLELSFRRRRPKELCPASPVAGNRWSVLPSHGRGTKVRALVAGWPATRIQDGHLVNWNHAHIYAFVMFMCFFVCCVLFLYYYYSMYTVSGIEKWAAHQPHKVGDPNMNDTMLGHCFLAGWVNVGGKDCNNHCNFKGG